MSYYITKTVSMDFDTAVEDLTAKLKAQGFGILTDIDVKGTLKSKLGADTPKYRIPGACNPKLGYEALKLEDELGVWETADQKVEVAAVDPVAAMERTGNPALRATAEQVKTFCPLRSRLSADSDEHRAQRRAISLEMLAIVPESNDRLVDAALVAENGKRRGVEKQVPADGAVEAEPARCKHPQQVSAREDEHVGARCLQARGDPIRACCHL